MKVALFASVIAIGVAFASAGQLPLPRGWVPFTEVTSSCKGALVATLLSAESAGAGPPGCSYFHSRWKVLKTFRGTYPDEVALDFAIQTFPEKDRERMPEQGHAYILLTYPSNIYQIAFMFDHTEEKSHEIQELLGSVSK
jgi:hypothetical protein